MAISSELFGANFLLTKDMTDEGGPFDRFTDMMSTSSLRYPGGTVTEALDPDDGSWDRIFGEAGDVGAADRVVTVGEAFEFAAGKDAGINFVLPTEHWLTDGAYGTRGVDTAAVDEMMDRVKEMISGQYGDVRIDTFEIGNEYWYLQARMTPEEYAKIADYMAIRLQQTFDDYRAQLGDEGDDWQEPDIAVQSGAYWKSGVNESKIIIDGLSMEARDAIDTVVSHAYPGNVVNADLPRMYSHLEQFSNAPGMEGVDFYVSEWNVNSGAEVKGFESIDTFMTTFDEMVGHGVDRATVWGTSYKNLDSRLAGMSNNHADGVDPEDVSLWLTPTGEIYRIMAQKLPGLEVTDRSAAEVLDRGSNNALSIHSYEADGKKVIFILSTSDASQTISLDLEALVGEGDHIWATTMRAVDNPATNVNEGDPTHQRALAQLDTLNADELAGNGGTVSLNPYGVIVIEITPEGEGVFMQGHDQGIIPGLSYEDMLIGGSGDDTILGHHGDDTLIGNEGNDLIYGGTGNDHLFGGEGSDRLYGGDGNDTIDIGPGGGFAYGGAGNDTITADEGLNRIFTGEGTDTVNLGQGTNFLTLEGGNNTVHIDTAGDSFIRGIDTDAGDRLDFGDDYTSLSEIRDHSALSGSENQHLVITHSDGGTTTLVDGAGLLDNLSALFPELEDDLSDAFPETDGGGSEEAEFDGDPDELVIAEENGSEITTGSGNDTIVSSQGHDTIHAGAGDDVILIDISEGGHEIHGEEGSDLYALFGDPEDTEEEISMPDFDPDEDELELNGEHIDFANLPDWARLETNSGDLRMVLSENAVLNFGNADRFEDREWFHDVEDNTPAEEEEEPPLPHVPVDEDEEDDPDPEEEENQQVAVDGSCFVATAAYGGGHHPDVVRMRAWRDEHLVRHPFGRAFIAFYWRVGPALARGVGPSRILRAMVRGIVRGILKAV